MNLKKIILAAIGVAIAISLVVGAAMTKDVWMPLVSSEPNAAPEEASAPVQDAKMLRLSSQARENMELVSASAELRDYWRTIQIPGIVVDRPGVSDRGVTSPAVGVVTSIHAYAGDTVRPGQPLFTLRLFSEYLQNTQSELFKARRETELIQTERDRIEDLATSGTIPGNRLIELDQQLSRQATLIQAYRQDLLTRGLTPEQVSEIEQGTFVATITISAPPFTEETAETENPEIRPVAFAEDVGGQELIYEVQELQVELGQQVQAGQLLTMLSNHRLLYIEGHAFKQDAPMLEHAAQQGWAIDVEFAEDDTQHWPPLEQTFEIRHLANTIDSTSRTFDFFISLTNQSRTYEKDGMTFVVWRFRPGQRVRLHVPVEHLEDVIVLPAAAVVREGPEAYVFRQNGDLFNRLPVHVLHEDRRYVVLANDGSVRPGSFLAQSSAASLNRVLKAQAASGQRADVHVHADGTVHASH